MKTSQTGMGVMPPDVDPEETRLKPGRVAVIVLYLVFAAIVARTLTIEANRPLIPRYLGLELVFLILFSAGLVMPGMPQWLLHLYLAFQSGLVLVILSLRPEFDFVVLLFLLLTYQATLFLTGRLRWAWIILLAALTGGSLIFYLGIVRGLALALTTMAADIILPAYLIVHHQTETARARSQVLLNELGEAHRQLQSYAGQVEELASIQERNRLARELHDTVSQLVFSIHLAARSAQLLLERDPARLPAQLDLLQEMAGDALGQLRSLITQLRPPQDS